MTYRIETRENPDSAWHAHIGDQNVFDAISDADYAIDDLRTLGQDWADAEYRIVKIPYESTTPAHATWTECAYCGRDVHAQPEDVAPPNLADDDAWVELAACHAEDCEWIATRAHRQ